MRILILTQWFDPEPTFKGVPFANELQQRGHDVRVLTGFPNYPGGKLYPGYQLRPWMREEINSVPVTRVYLYPSHDRSATRRSANYLSFAVSTALTCIGISRPDVAYVYHPPGTMGLPAMVLRRMRCVPVVYDVQDLWPDSIRTSGMLQPSPILRLLDGWCRSVYKRADRLVTLSEGMRRVLIERGACPERTHVIHNWSDERASEHGTMASGVAGQLSAAGRFVIMFAGTMGMAQGLDAVLDAAAICARTVPKALFVFVGGGVARVDLESRARQMTLDNVRFVERQPLSAMPGILASANVLLVHLKDDPLFEVTIPSKTQAYLASGKPILMAVRGDAARLVEAAGAGVCAEPERPESIARAVARLFQLGEGELRAMGARGAAYYAQHLSIASGVSKFERLFALAVRDAACGASWAGH